jgi:hypothetical protein
MAKYRKKPVVIEAYCPYKGKMPEWLESALCNRGIRERVSGGFDIDTLEGTMHASEGDYIIKGVNGEFYPCKPEIFKKTYELVEGEKRFCIPIFLTTWILRFKISKTRYMNFRKGRKNAKKLESLSDYFKPKKKRR